MTKTHLVQPAALAPLEATLGHIFSRPELLLRALTHRSQSFESAMEGKTESKSDQTNRAGSSLIESGSGRTDNERLEFLGDSVLGLVIAEALFERHPDWQEGELTRLRAQLVSRKHLGEVALAIGLGDYLQLGRGEERSGGRKKAAILANAMEAVLAAMYLDARSSENSLAPHRIGPDGIGPDTISPDWIAPDGLAPDGLAPVRRFAERYILGATADGLAEKLRAGSSLGDYKSALQEVLQSSRAGIPIYSVESESGPDHRKRFKVALHVKAANSGLGETIASGTGSTKKKAEQEAARQALLRFTAETHQRERSDQQPPIRVEEPVEV